LSKQNLRKFLIYFLLEGCRLTIAGNGLQAGVRFCNYKLSNLILIRKSGRLLAVRQCY
jgi:hypothetical protein